MPAGIAQPPPLTGRDVHVWEGSLHPGPSHLDELARTLSEDERARADRFVAERDRRRFVACRGLLRAILGGYLRAPAGTLAFTYGPYGKPALADAGEALRFNVTHSADVALYAVAVRREVGIDLEYIRPDIAIDDIAAKMFPPHETQALREAGAGDRVRMFFRLWTRREAYLKARGQGFATAAADVNPGPAPAWSVVDLPVDPRYAAALAVEGQNWQLQRLTWPDVPSA